MQIIDTPEYRKAFVQYLRRGAPIDVSLKAITEKRLATHYIWRTSGDEKVRAAHAANNGKIFAWDNPPDTSHPGEDYNCRCWAEPYYGIIEGSLNRVSEKVVVILEYFRRLLSTVWRWEDRHFAAHFYVGGGRKITLDKIGHLKNIQTYYETHYLERFVAQIRKNSAIHTQGRFEDDFQRVYDFRPAQYSHGGATISGIFNCHIVINNDGSKTVTGKANIHFSDVFTDPVRLIDRVLPFLNITPAEWMVLFGELG
ncbi:MAG: minor capsid protein, partial [Alphaproteobacteria bacterium]|nr:minor capsid protein [Alphaproteobacteria bacterium]